LQGILLGDLQAADLGQLNQLAFDHLLGEVDQDIEHVKIAFFQGDLERLHIEPIPCQNAPVIAPARVGGRTATTCIGAVDDVIVNEGSAVEKFNDSG